MKSRLASYSLLAALVLSAAGCAAPSPASLGRPATSSGDESGASKKAPAGTTTGSATTGATGSASAPQAKPGGPVSNGAGNLADNGGSLIGGDAASEAPRPAASSAPSTGGASAPAMPGIAVGEPNPAQPPVQNEEALKAGAVDDNAKFSTYLEYLAEFDWEDLNPVARPRKVDVADRHVIRVVDKDGKGVANATVAIKAGDATIATVKTYADGRALFHPGAYGDLQQTAAFTVAVTKGELAGSADFDADEDVESWEVKLTEAVAKPAAKLDMALVIDTTGSMGGEIAKFQSTFASIVSRVQALPQQPSVRFGLVAYKDAREQYVSKVASPFTTDTAAFQSALNGLSAGGGGDKPEDLESALGDTVNTLAWDGGESVRLSFVVTDASLHTDYEQNTPYTDSMKLASEKGIKLYPIGASSLEPEGEYALRQLAQWTMGQYLFVTRGGDEATGGGGTASATVDKFREGRLDDIVVDIVKAELEKLGQ